MTDQPDATRRFARARDVHANLGRAFKAVLAPIGYRRIRPGVCAFGRLRNDGAGFVTVGVQASQWGSAETGSSFTLNASGAAIQLEDYAFTTIRPLSWLSIDDCAAGLMIERRIRARFPVPPPGHIASSKMWQPGHDVWLTYFDVSDVGEWGEFLRSRLPTLLERVEAETPPRTDV